jgi:hypothetical protein
MPSATTKRPSRQGRFVRKAPCKCGVLRLRRLVACGEDPASVMAQLGHSDPNFTLWTYTYLMRREPDERARLKALVNAEPSPPADRRDPSEQTPWPS